MANRPKRPEWKYWPESVALIISVAAVPVIAGWVPPNPYYGFRTPHTMASPQEWYFANRLMGLYMVASQVGAITSMHAACRAMTQRFGKERATWGALWSSAMALVGIGVGVVHYYFFR